MSDNIKLTGKWADPNIYGIDWNADDENPQKTMGSRIRTKPFCTFEGCNERVSTEFGRLKPFCKDHVLENPYVKGVVARLAALDDKADQKVAKEAFKRLEEEYERDQDIS